MNYKVLSNQAVKEHVDLQIKGAIFDSHGNITANYFNSGHKLPDTFYTIKIFEEYYTKGKIRDKISVEVNGCSDLFVVSPKTAKLFRSLNISNIELIDLNIHGKNLKINDYCMVNIIGKIDCADDFNSQFAYFTDIRPTYIYSIEKLSLDLTKMPNDSPIFLMDRTDNLVIIVRQDLIQEIQMAELSGFNFLNPSDFYIG